MTDAPWTDLEVATLMRGFIDLDLDGQELYAWCKRHGVDHRPSRIDDKLAAVRFFDDDPQPLHIVRKDGVTLQRERRDAARVNLRNQISLAVAEAKIAPPYKHGKLEW